VGRASSPSKRYCGRLRVIYTSERVTRLEEKDCETLVEEKEEGNGDEGAEDQLTRWTTAWAPPLPGEPIDAEMPTPFYYSRYK
jgi:hypothetical protein